MSTPKSLFSPIESRARTVRRRMAIFINLIVGSADIRGSIFLGLLAVGIIWVGAWLMISEDARRTEDAAYHETVNMARVFEENIIRLIQAHDQILLSARSSLAKDPDHFDLVSWAREQKFATEVSLQIVIINKAGMLAGTTLGMPPNPVDLRDREHFRVHVDATGDELFISKPLLGRVSNQWSIQLSRRLTAADGSFAGVILVSMDPYYLANFYESIDTRKNGMVLLAGLDGIVRARVSAGDRTIGQSIASGGLFQRFALASSGSYVTDGKQDGAARFTSYRRVRGYPLVVAVGLARSEILTTVERHRVLYCGVAGFVSMLILIFVATIVRRQIGLQRAREELWKAANVDALTRLPNRNRLHDIVGAMTSKAQVDQARFAILLIDVDNFKLINDTLGHEAGDIVLRIAARRLDRMCGKVRVVARLGGDEFAMLLHDMGEQRELEDVALRVMSAIRKKVKYRGHAIETSISIGIACFPDHANTWAEVFRAADLALYRAKQAGRNRAVIFDPSMSVEIQNKFALVEFARAAIRNDRVVPVYQPEINIKTGEIVGFEALARIAQHGGDRLAAPAEFLSGLEDPEVGTAFGLKMLEKVISDLKYWVESGIDVKRVAVNASNVELRTGNYVSFRF
jgi:diguanylate cyclase (GGDEF)-like protein